MVHKLEKTVFFPYPVEKIFAYHSNIKELVRLLPEHLHMKIISAPEEFKVGDTVRLMGRLYIIPFIWKSRITQYESNVSFTDVSEQGPFTLWKHEHLFEAHNGGTLMTDRIEYTLSFSIFGEIAHSIFVRSELDKIFTCRHKKALEYLRG